MVILFSDHQFQRSLILRNQLAAEFIMDVFSSQSKRNAAMVLGHQGVGKSSFCCFLINSLLTVFDRVRNNCNNVI